MRKCGHDRWFAAQVPLPGAQELQALWSSLQERQQAQVSEPASLRQVLQRPSAVAGSKLQASPPVRS